MYHWLEPGLLCHPVSIIIKVGWKKEKHIAKVQEDTLVRPEHLEIDCTCKMNFLLRLVTNNFLAIFYF